LTGAMLHRVHVLPVPLDLCRSDANLVVVCVDLCLLGDLGGVLVSTHDDS
jgi:hypothetical protein